MSGQLESTYVIVLPPGTPDAKAVVHEAMRHGSTLIADANAMRGALSQSFEALRPTIFCNSSVAFLRAIARRGNKVTQLSEFEKGWATCEAFYRKGARQKGVFWLGSDNRTAVIDVGPR